MDLDEIVEKINDIAQKKKTVLIAIDGRSGSGKSSLAAKLQDKLRSVKIYHLDEFDLYEDNTQKVIDNLIKPIQSADKKEIIVLEGIFALRHELEGYYDYKIWVECPTEIGFQRGLQRDINLNAIDNSKKWTTYWLPKEKE